MDEIEGDFGEKGMVLRVGHEGLVLGLDVVEGQVIGLAHEDAVVKAGGFLVGDDPFECLTLFFHFEVDVFEGVQVCPLEAAGNAAFPVEYGEKVGGQFVGQGDLFCLGNVFLAQEQHVAVIEELDFVEQSAELALGVGLVVDVPKDPKDGCLQLVEGVVEVFFGNGVGTLLFDRGQIKLVGSVQGLEQVVVFGQTLSFSRPDVLGEQLLFIGSHALDQKKYRSFYWLGIHFFRNKYLLWKDRKAIFELFTLELELQFFPKSLLETQF